MIKLDEIKVLGDSGMWCHDKAIASVATWLRGEFDLAYRDTWQFDYEKKGNDTIGNALKTDLWNQDFNLEKYYGIKFSKLAFDDPEDFVSFVKKELSEERPVVCEFNNYYAPWVTGPRSDVFDKFNSVLLIVGLLPDEKSVHIFDVHLGGHESDLSLDNLRKGYISQTCIPTGFSFAKEGMQNINYQVIIPEIVSQIKDKASGNNMFDRINMFAYDLENSFDFDNETMDIKRAEDTPLISNIETLIRSRIMFSYFLTYMGKKLSNQTIIDIADEFKFTKWTFVKSSIVKALYKRIIYGNMIEKLPARIYKTIKDIALDEEKIANDLLMAFKAPQTFTQDDKTSTVNMNDCVLLEISDLYNNDAFPKVEINKKSPDISAYNLYFLTEGIEEITGIFTCGNMTFSFPGVTEGKSNNFLCAEQEIMIPDGVYSSVCFLATAETECVKDRAKIVYRNGDIMDMTFKISDWWYETSIHNELIAWEGQIAQVFDIPKDDKCNIYAVECDLPMSGSIKKIVLPFRPTLHIFAMSMRKG